MNKRAGKISRFCIFFIAALFFGIAVSEAEQNSGPIYQVDQMGVYPTPPDSLGTMRLPNPNSDIQVKIEVLRQIWCSTITGAERDSNCPGPGGSAPVVSEEYRSLCGDATPDVCRAALGLTPEKCPSYVHRPGGC